MPLPITLTVAYLAVNLAMMFWLELERAGGRTPASRVTALSYALRYGPALVGAGYLVTIAGDWLFFLFVCVFFAGAFWLLNGLLAFTPSDHSEAARRGGRRDRGAGAGDDRDRA